MKWIQFFHAEKYRLPEYKQVTSGVFQHGRDFVTSLSFVQEPQYDEGANASDISQYPLEDILDRFGVFISDFYPELNTEASERCYLEFSGGNREDVIRLLSIVGHHVYNVTVEKDGKQYIDLVIE